MERRVLLAITLSFAVLFAYQAFFVPPPPPVEPGNITAPPPASQAPAPATLPSGNLSPPVPAPPPASTPLVGESEEREIVVETEHVRAVFTNRGGRLRHWILKNFRNKQEQPIDLIPEFIPPPLPVPFSLRLDDPTVTGRLNESLYRVSGPTDGTVTFDLETAEGLKARKVMTIDPQTFILRFTSEVTQNGQALNPTIELGPGVTDEIARTPPGSFLSPAYVYKAEAIYHDGSEVTREAASALAGGAVREGRYRWAGIDDHYFIKTLIQPPGQEPLPVRLEYQPVAIPAPETPSTLGQYMAYAVRFPASPTNVRFYLGPKQLDVLRSIDPELTRAIYFGIFAWLAAPLLDALRWVHGYIGNWGWSIIALTVLINLVMFPLRHKSVVSMRKMQEIQPQMKAIQDRYKKYKVTDPERQKMNTEVMELYRVKGVNPASGCVPMLLTLPFLFAFYAMLGQAIEIRGESFWWIRDLAAQDPLFILPALMGLTMFWQQKITPTTADPTQQKIMMFMPVMITVTMLFAPAGLVLYWFVSQTWGIGQQYATNWLIGQPRPTAAAARAAGDVKNTKTTKPAPPDIVVPPNRNKK
jgi:YidC/Oxa1 family membrane protein insertase